MKRWIFRVIFVSLLVISGCTNENPVASDTELIVIRGYLYANEPVNDIQITHTLPLGSEETTAPAINDAQVFLIRGEKRYALVPSAGDSGYYHYEGTDLAVETGDEFIIEVSYNDHQVSATTVVPEAPENLTISNTTLKFPDFDSMRDLRDQGISMDSIRKAMTLSVSWDNEADALYYVVVENIDPNPVEVEQQFGQGGGRGPSRFISMPMATGEYMVNAMMMTHLGKHQVKVYHVNQEYADLYQSRNQDSRDLNEPLTNVVNGLGIFSAFNSRSVYFEFLE